jgi:hypothetical protein
MNKSLETLRAERDKAFALANTLALANPANNRCPHLLHQDGCVPEVEFLEAFAAAEAASMAYSKELRQL